jgi:hypothetical protein
MAINMKKNIYTIFCLMILILTSCNEQLSNKVNTTVTPEISLGREYLSSHLTCENVLEITIGEGESEFFPFDDRNAVIYTPTQLIISDEGQVILADPNNNRIILYDNGFEDSTVINIPRYSGEDQNHNYPIWLGLVVSNERIFILHNPIVNPEGHMVLTIHSLDGNELALRDFSTISELSEGLRDEADYLWNVANIASDGLGGVYIKLNYFNVIHVDRNMETSLINIPREFQSLNRDLVSGWDGFSYTLDSTGDGIIQINFEINQYTEVTELNSRLTLLGINMLLPLGADQNGNMYFTGFSGSYDQYLDVVGRFNPFTGELLIADVDPSISNNVEIYLGGGFMLAPNGIIFGFDNANWPESRELLRCEFVPLS